MLTIEELHEQAVDIAEEAFLLRRKGLEEDAKSLFLEALALERQAALSYTLDSATEPTRSILFRSAAALAFHAGDYEQAEQLVSNGLAGFPPLEIRNELRALRDDIEFRYHITRHGAELTEQQMQLTLWGTATGYGVIPIDLLIRKVEQIKSIFYRTVERMADLPYRVSGRPPKLVTDYYNLFLNAFVPGSFGVTFTVGQPMRQLELYPDYDGAKIQAADIISEVVTCFELIQEDDLAALQQRFNDKNYLQNFVAIAKQMAPDGEDVKALGLSVNQNGEEKTVNIRRTKAEMLLTIRKVIEADNQEHTIFTLEGQLKVADSLTINKDMGSVKLVDDNGVKHTIRVPISQMQDVVQPYFDEQVMITGYKKGNSQVLTDIGKREKNMREKIPSTSSSFSNIPSLFDQDIDSHSNE